MNDDDLRELLRADVLELANHFDECAIRAYDAIGRSTHLADEWLLGAHSSFAMAAIELRGRLNKAGDNPWRVSD